MSPKLWIWDPGGPGGSPGPLDAPGRPRRGSQGPLGSEHATSASSHPARLRENLIASVIRININYIRTVDQIHLRYMKHTLVLHFMIHECTSVFYNKEFLRAYIP